MVSQRSPFAGLRGLYPGPARRPDKPSDGDRIALPAGRRRRAGELSEALERRAFATFENDLAQGSLDLRPLHDGQAILALELLSALRRHALSMIDALHLAVARDAAATAIASADRVMIAAAESLGFEVVRFD